jgi:hypothetical protein
LECGKVVTANRLVIPLGGVLRECSGGQTGKDNGTDQSRKWHRISSAMGTRRPKDFGLMNCYKNKTPSK